MAPVLDPAGPFAEPVSILSWTLFVGGGVVLLVVVIALVLAIWGRPAWKRLLGGEGWVMGAGLFFPAVVLTVLLVWGLTLTSGLTKPADDPMRVRITGEQWWWRVEYLGANGLTEANELHIPTGRTVRLELEAQDVIHSFWVPQLAGKLDMIPGRTNVLQIRAEHPGLYRGQCAEYCGGAHANMAFVVVAHAPDDFARWMDATLRPAITPAGEEAERGEDLFMNSGCVVCHAVRGTVAGGRTGPDLTHVASRRALAAGALPNTRGSYAAWIAGNQQIKPHNRMPEFTQFSGPQLNDLAVYLEGLK